MAVGAKHKEKGGGKKVKEAGTCRVEAVVGVDERGQMVLPKDVRERLGIAAGDRLALATWERPGKPSCITLLRTEEISEKMREVLGPLMKDLL